jgi:cell division protein FtsW (lipid II flippase)
MEFANLTLILVIAWLVWKKPDRERVAFGLLVTSVALMAFLFFLATRSSILPPANY